MCWQRLQRISAANIGLNRFHQKRTVSWQMSTPRSASRSSTSRRDSGYFTYIITTRRMGSRDELKRRNGLAGLIMPTQLAADAYPAANLL
jgi:hypothetical protein